MVDPRREEPGFTTTSSDYGDFVRGVGRTRGAVLLRYILHTTERHPWAIRCHKQTNK